MSSEASWPDRPETTFAYWERKNDEVALLRARLGLDGGRAIVTVPDLVHEKQLLRAQMVARFIAGHPTLTESNLGAWYDMDVDGSRVGFSYQRYDMTVRRRPFAPWIHPGLASPRLCSLGFLTASGMSSVTAVLTALDLSHGEPRPLYLAPDSYFETQQFARSYLYQLRATHQLGESGEPLVDCGVLLLDSIGAADPLAWLGPRSLAPLCAVIFDTTTYDVTAPEIGRVVERCHAEGVPCVLVRSHIKIDSLGMEYGRMGSIAVVLPRPLPRTRAKFVQWLRFRVRDFLVKVGAGLSLASYFPLASDAAFQRLNQRRNARMRDNNLRAAAELAARLHPRARARVTGYHHGRFLFLHLPVGDPDGARARELGLALLEAGVAARVAPSFGYDFLGITRMVVESPLDGASLRLSLADGPVEELEQSIETIARFALALDQESSSST